MICKVILTDLKTDGSMPIDCELTVSYDTSSNSVESLNVKLEDLDLEIAVPMYQLGLVLGNEEHG